MSEMNRQFKLVKVCRLGHSVAVLVDGIYAAGANGHNASGGRYAQIRGGPRGSLSDDEEEEELTGDFDGAPTYGRSAPRSCSWW